MRAWLTPAPSSLSFVGSEPAGMNTNIIGDGDGDGDGGGDDGDGDSIAKVVAVVAVV